MTGNRWRGSVVNPGAAVGAGQNCLWAGVDPTDDREPMMKVVGFCCANPDHGDDPCAANDHGGWLDMADMLRYAADALKPGCQVAFLLLPPAKVDKPEGSR